MTKIINVLYIASRGEEGAGGENYLLTLFRNIDLETVVPIVILPSDGSLRGPLEALGIDNDDEVPSRQRNQDTLFAFQRKGSRISGTKGEHVLPAVGPAGGLRRDPQVGTALSGSAGGDEP